MPLIKIHIKGRIGPEILDWFQGFTIEPVTSEESCLCAEVVDNSAIYGILSTLSSLGISLVSVSLIDIKEEKKIQ